MLLMASSGTRLASVKLRAR